MDAPERPLFRVLKSRIRRVPIRTIRSSIWVGKRGCSIPLTGAYKARRIKVFSPLIVRRQPAFSGRPKFFACGGRWRRRTCSISPGWNREGRAGRRQRTAFVPFDEAKQSPTIHPKAGQQRGTTCTAGSRKCSARKLVLASSISLAFL